ncbi:MAG: hypothetical protein ACJ75B_08020 [Flavisolibacter sp.]
MYNATWKKYLPVIRILLKSAVREPQSLQLNVSDFEKIGPQKKTGFNFALKFTKGRVDNLATLSNTAKELAGVLLQEPQINELLQLREYVLTMNSKYVLGITVVSTIDKEPESLELAEAAEQAVD